uniref:Uncharacterized protein n=1 Tax=Ananas comosus var. bracteatus TaxID=296719 RepID=A0A6V7NNA7_ANACO|nr:unnamed protein product [Ananas comosus var. bracteatus]
MLDMYETDSPSPPRLLVLVPTPTASAAAAANVGGATALVEENERLRRSNAAVVAELAPSSAASPLVAARGLRGLVDQRRSAAAKPELNSASTTSSSSLTIADEPSTPPLPPPPPENQNDNGETSNARPKLFGVPLNGCSPKRALNRDEPTSPSTKPLFSVAGAGVVGVGVRPSAADAISAVRPSAAASSGAAAACTGPPSRPPRGPSPPRRPYPCC